MNEAKLNILKNQLYEQCIDQLESGDDKAYDRIFTQEELQAMNIVAPNDVKTLVTLVQMLTDDWLFIVVNTGSGMGWRLRPEVEAQKYHGLTQEQTVVYALIDNAGAEGIWQQEIRKKANIRDQTSLRKVLKELETQKKLITSFTSVQQASHRCYIKASIKPSEKATGGPWFSDADLDESFIQALLNLCYSMIKEQGSYKSLSGGGMRSASTSPVLPKKVIMGSASDAAMRGRKRSAETMIIEDGGDPFADSPPKSRRKSSYQPMWLPMPAGYKRYVTLPELTERIAKSGVTRGNPLKEADIKQLLEVLTFDGRIEEVKVGSRVGFRIKRVIKAEPELRNVEDDDGDPATNGLTTAPCGRCPVFELCEEGGPVWAGGCEYFDKWLI